MKQQALTPAELDDCIKQLQQAQQNVEAASAVLRGHLSPINARHLSKISDPLFLLISNLQHEHNNTTGEKGSNKNRTR